MAHIHTKLLIPHRIQIVYLDTGFDDGGCAETDSEEGVCQVTTANVEEDIISVW